jgi:hypothetical protein
MPIWFQNFYTDPVYVAYIWQDWACKSRYSKNGWYIAAPGETIQVVSEDLRIFGGGFCWFAQADNAAGPCWSGNQFYDVTDNSFHQCYDDNTNCNRSIPFIGTSVTNRWYGITIMLLAPGTANQPNQGFAWATSNYSDQPPYAGGNNPILGSGSTPSGDQNPG